MRGRFISRPGPHLTLVSDKTRPKMSETGRGYFRHPVSPLVPHSGSVLFSLERPCNWQDGQFDHLQQRRKVRTRFFGVKFCGMFLSIASGFAKESCTKIYLFI